MMLSIRKSAANGLLGTMMACLLGIGVAHADRLEEIKARGKLICATLTTSEPGGFQDPVTRKIVGVDVDLCAAIAKRMGLELEHKGVTVDARIPELNLGRVDLVAAGLGYTKERAQQIDYTHSHYQNPIRMMVLKDSPVAKLADLAGKRVSAIRGSTSEFFTSRALPTAELVTFADGPTAYLALQQGKTQGVAMSTTAAVRYLNEPDSRIRLIQEAIAWEPSGLGVKKGEAALLAEVNRILEAMESSGELEEIWVRWYGPKTKYNLPREKKLTPISELPEQ
jgi:polar amino acid transport system substrate-binding protein